MLFGDPKSKYLPIEHTYALPAKTMGESVPVWLKKQKRTEARRHKDWQLQKICVNIGTAYTKLKDFEKMEKKSYSSDA